MSGLLVAQGQERFIKPLAEYTEQQSSNKLEYITGQNPNGQKRAMDTIVYGLAPISNGNLVAAGSTKRIIKKVAHNARRNDVVQFTSGPSQGVSIQILSCPDADTMILAATSEFAINIGDAFDIKRYVNPQYDEDGALTVTSTPGPTQFVLNGSDVEVEEDSADPTNNKPLPSKLFIQKDGESLPVNKTTGVPSETVAIPVEIVSASGSEINITAGDINIQTTSEGPTFDSMRLGSGVGLYAEITPNSELSVHDQDVLDELDSQTTLLATITTEIGEINTKTPMLVGGSVPVVGPLTDVQLRATAVPVSGPLTDTQLRATAVPVIANAGTNLNTSALSLEATQLLVKAKTDNLDVLLSTRATNADLLAMSAKLPTTLGAKTGANSLSIVPATDAVFGTSSTPGGTSTFATQTVVHGAVSTFTVPANAKRMVVYNNADDVTGANRVRRGNVAVAPNWATSVGPILGVGSFTSELPATTFTCIAENASASANISVEYFY